MTTDRPPSVAELVHQIDEDGGTAYDLWNLLGRYDYVIVNRSQMIAFLEREGE